MQNLTFSLLTVFNEANVQLGHVPCSLQTNSRVDTENYFCMHFTSMQPLLMEIKSTEYSENIFLLITLNLILRKNVRIGICKCLCQLCGRQPNRIKIALILCLCVHNKTTGIFRHFPDICQTIDICCLYFKFPQIQSNLSFFQTEQQSLLTK